MCYILCALESPRTLTGRRSSFGSIIAVVDLIDCYDYALDIVFPLHCTSRGACTKSVNIALGALNFNRLTVRDFTNLSYDGSDEDAGASGTEETVTEPRDQQFAEIKGESFVVKHLIIDPALPHSRAKKNSPNPGSPLEQVTAASLYACYKIAVVRADLVAGAYVSKF